MNGGLTYNDFLQRLRIQDVLVDAGYHLNKRDGLRYPSFVRTDSDGRRVHGDKFLVTPNGQCCFQPPRQKLYNVSPSSRNIQKNLTNIEQECPRTDW